MKLLLKPGHLTLSDIQLALRHTTTLVLDKKCHAKIKASHQLVATLMQKNRVVYGINTGFGPLSATRVSEDKLEEHQINLLHHLSL